MSGMRASLSVTGNGDDLACEFAALGTGTVAVHLVQGSTDLLISSFLEA